MKFKLILSYLLIICAVLMITAVFIRIPIYAAEAIKFSNLDNLFDSIVKTIQFYSLPVMTLALALLGIKLVASGDDTASKDLVKSWMIKIIIGGLIIFGASLIAGLIQKAVGGV